MQKRWKKNSKIYLPIKEQKNDLRPKSEQTHKPNGKIMKFQIFFSDLISVDLLLLFLPPTSLLLHLNRIYLQSSFSMQFHRESPSVSLHPCVDEGLRVIFLRDHQIDSSQC